MGFYNYHFWVKLIIFFLLSEEVAEAGKGRPRPGGPNGQRPGAPQRGPAPRRSPGSATGPQILLPRGSPYLPGSNNSGRPSTPLPPSLPPASSIDGVMRNNEQIAPNAKIDPPADPPRKRPPIEAPKVKSLISDKPIKPIKLTVFGVGHEEIYEEKKPDKTKLAQNGVFQNADKDALAKCHAILGKDATIERSGIGRGMWLDTPLSYEEDEKKSAFAYEQAYICRLDKYSRKDLSDKMAEILLDPKPFDKYRFKAFNNFNYATELANEVIEQIGPEALNALLPHLKSPDMITQSHIVRAIGKSQIKGPQSPELIEFLFKLGDEVDGEIKDTELDHSITLALDDITKHAKEQNVVDELVNSSLRRIGVPRKLEGISWNLKTVLYELGPKAKRVKPKLYAALQNSDEMERLGYLSLISRIGLEDNDEEIGRFVHLMDRGAKGNNYLTHIEVIFLLNNLEGLNLRPESINKIYKALLPYLEDGLNWKEIGAEKSILRFLKEIGRPSDPNLRERAEKRAAQIARLVGVPEEDREMFEHSAKVAEDFLDPHRSARLKAEKEKQHALEKAHLEKLIAEIKDKKVDSLKYLKHGHPEVRQAAVRKLPNDDDRLDRLIEALFDKDVGVRWGAIDKLLYFQEDEILEKTLPLLDSPDENRRSAITELYRFMGKKAEPAREALFEMITKYPGAMRTTSIREASALLSLGITENDLPILLKLLRNTKLSPDRRASVIGMLSQLGPAAKAAIPDLAQIIETDVLKIDSMKVGERVNPQGDIYEAIEALEKIGPSQDAALNRRIVKRLDAFADVIDEFNVPAWIVKDAARISLAWRKADPAAFAGMPAPTHWGLKGFPDLEPHRTRENASAKKIEKAETHVPNKVAQPNPAVAAVKTKPSEPLMKGWSFSLRVTNGEPDPVSQDQVDASLQKLFSKDDHKRIDGVWELEKMPQDAYLSKLLPLLDHQSPTVRSSVLDLITYRKIEAARKKIYESFEKHLASPPYNTQEDRPLIRLGVTEKDLPELLRLFRKPSLPPQRRVTLLRLFASLKEKGKEALEDIFKLISTDLAKLPRSEAEKRTWVDGDLAEALITLKEIGPSQDPKLNEKITSRLKEILKKHVGIDPDYGFVIGGSFENKIREVLESWNRAVREKKVEGSTILPRTTQTHR